MKLRLGLLLVAIASAISSMAVTSGPPAAFFGTPTAESTLGEPITFHTTFTTSEQAPPRVELLVRLPDQTALTVLPAQVSGGPGELTATAVLEGHQAPNTTLIYQFRARGVGPTALGPEAQVTVLDDRFEWRTLEGEVVRLHWYEGSEAFAQRALQIGEEAVRNARDLLGVTDFAPVDFFIYGSEVDFRGALGPGTRENVAGQAHSNIRTMFGLLEPHEIDSDWVDILVAHELTHLVFDAATDNPLHLPPRWLNEGVAVYLSEGNSASRREPVDRARREDSLIPLDGLGGLFPTTFDEFLLAYGESVSAVDYFVRTHGEEKLWQLVRSYAAGVSDDEAFIAATGADLAAFNADWMDSLGTEVPLPFGPQPGPTGPVPAGWNVGPAPTLRPGEPTPAAPRPTATPAGAPSSPADDEGRLVVLVLFVVVGAALAVLLIVLLAMRQTARRPPPPGPWQAPPGSWPPTQTPQP
jgi:hypothetical protein